MHPLFDAVMAATRGEFPLPDGGVDVVAPDGQGTHAVVEFTAHSFVLTNHAPEEVIAHGADGLGGASSPNVVRWLAGEGGWIGSHDLVLFARAHGVVSGTVR